MERVLEVYRAPVPDTMAPFEWRYASTVVLGPESVVAPLAAPGSGVLVANLLP